MCKLAGQYSHYQSQRKWRLRSQQRVTRPPLNTKETNPFQVPLVSLLQQVKMRMQGRRGLPPWRFKWVIHAPHRTCKPLFKDTYLVSHKDSRSGPAISNLRHKGTIIHTNMELLLMHRTMLTDNRCMVLVCLFMVMFNLPMRVASINLLFTTSSIGWSASVVCLRTIFLFPFLLKLAIPLKQVVIISFSVPASFCLSDSVHFHSEECMHSFRLFLILRFLFCCYHDIII